MHEVRLGLSDRPKMCLKLVTRFSTFKQPKRRIKMAAQSCTFSTEMRLRMPKRNEMFRDRTHPFDTGI